MKVKLLTDPNQGHPKEKVLLVCLVEGREAGSARVEWLMNHEVVNLAQESYACDKCSDEKATFTSKVNVSRQSWDLGAEFSCRVTHSSLKEPAVLNISAFCLGEAEGGGVSRRTRAGRESEEKGGRLVGSAREG